MRRGRVMHHVIKPFDRDKVAQEDVGDHQRGENIRAVLQNTLGDLRRRPGSRIQPAPRRCIAIDQPLDPAVDVLQEDRVRAGPPAPHTSKQRRHIEQRETDPRDEEKAHPQVLHRQRQAHEMETTVQHIEKHRRKAVHRNPRQRHIHDQQQQGEPPPPTRKLPAHISRVQCSFAPILIDGAKGNQIGRVHSYPHHGELPTPFSPPLALGSQDLALKPCTQSNSATSTTPPKPK